MMVSLHVISLHVLLMPLQDVLLVPIHVREQSIGDVVVTDRRDAHIKVRDLLGRFTTSLSHPRIELLQAIEGESKLGVADRPEQTRVRSG